MNGLRYHENNGWPSWAFDNPWPSRDKLLEHFHEVSEQFGILPYCRMQTNVRSLKLGVTVCKLCVTMAR